MRVILDTNVVVSGLTFSRDRALGLGIGPPRTVRLVLFFLHLGRGSRGFGPQVQLSRTPDLTVAPTQDVHWPTRLEVALSKSMFEVTCWRRAERSCDNGPATFQRHPRSLAVSGNAIGFTLTRSRTVNICAVWGVLWAPSRNRGEHADRRSTLVRGGGTSLVLPLSNQKLGFRRRRY